MGEFDGMPLIARERLRASPFNICAACAAQEAWDKRASTAKWPTAADYIKAIDQIEAQIRAEEPGNG